MTFLTYKNWFLAAVLGFSVIMSAGCNFDFDNITDVNKLRILAVGVNPPEVRDGYEGSVEFKALWHNPNKDQEVQFAWVLCAGAVPAGTGFQYCQLVDEKLMPPSVVNAKEGGDTYVIPFVPKELFSMLKEGASAQVTAITIMCAGGTLSSSNELLSSTKNANINTLCKGGQAVSAHKTVTFAHGNEFGDDVNSSPQLNEILLGNVELVDIATDANAVNEYTCDAKIGCDNEIALYADFTNSSYQEYTVIEFDEAKTEVERPYVSWFSTGGEFDESYVMAGEDGTVEPLNWNPKEPGNYILWAVANDRRGGITWKKFNINVTSP